MSNACISATLYQHAIISHEQLRLNVAQSGRQATPEESPDHRELPKMKIAAFLTALVSCLASATAFVTPLHATTFSASTRFAASAANTGSCTVSIPLILRMLSTKRDYSRHECATTTYSKGNATLS